MRVLIACETSGIARRAFAALGMMRAEAEQWGGHALRELAA